MTMVQNRVIALRGGNKTAFNARDREILVEGPRGTGKTRTILEKFHQLAMDHPGFVAAIVRKYQRTLAATCLRTFNEQVIHPGDGVAFFGGNEHEPASYRYRNGSRIVVGGMDNPEKVKSSEYDAIYVNEGTELTEEEYEALLPLLRHLINGEPVIEAQRIYVDCNPANAGHWLNQRAERGQMRRIRTYLKDNPAFYNEDGTLTSAGEAYVDTLQNLTGPRRERWLEGKWTGVENACYPAFDPDIHIRPLEPGLYFKETLIGVDYGSQHLCAVVALSIDQYNRRWVREAWAEADKDQGKSLTLIVSQFKERYKAVRGRVDPNQHFLAGRMGFSVARGGGVGRPRLHRIDLMERLFYTYAGGRVPSFHEEAALAIPRGPFEEPDSAGIFLVEGAPGIDDLVSEIDGYHYVFTETAKGKSKDVYRVDDDRIAALEYANEEYEEGDPRNFDATPSGSVLAFGTARQIGGVRTGT